MSDPDLTSPRDLHGAGVKAREYDIEDTNVAGIGSAENKAAREAAGKRGCGRL